MLTKSRKSSQNSSSAVSPGIKQIIPNPPSLFTPVSSFNYKSSLSSNDNGLTSMIINHITDTDCSNEAAPITNVNISSFSNSTNTITDIQLNNKIAINPSQQSFSPQLTIAITR